MRPYTVLWLLLFVAGVAVEVSALWRRVLEDTLTWNVKQLMLAHPLLAWVIPTAVVGFAVHLLLEYVK